jgi:hypothetical protein
VDLVDRHQGLAGPGRHRHQHLAAPACHGPFDRGVGFELVAAHPLVHRDGAQRFHLGLEVTL